MKWNLENIRFLHQPYDFVGTFTNEKMQERHEAMQDAKVKEIRKKLIEAKLPRQAMFVLNPTEHVQFIHNNLEEFRKTNSLEATVLKLYYRKNTPFAPAGIYETWLELLGLCDREKLLELGEPFPKEGMTAYRGSITNAEYGLSWTTDINEARWILNRWSDKEMGGGTVYQSTIYPDDILIYIVDGKRQEVLLKPEIAESKAFEIITSV